MFSMNQDVVQVHYDKDIKLLGKDLIDIALEVSWSIRQIKEYHLVFKVIIPYLEDCHLFIFFSNSHLLVYTS